MQLSEDEIELLAKRRMLKNVLDDVLDAMRAEAPNAAEEIDRILEDYVDEARNECRRASTVDEALECIMNVKQDREPEVRDMINRMR